MGRFKDLTGQRFGRLTVISFAGLDSHGRARWFCQCDCGKEKIVAGGHLTSGHTTSCGCYKIQRTSEGRHITHGGCHTRLYNIWSGMIQRGTNPKHKYSHRYIERGIAVCDEWLHSFEPFRDWALANGYADDLTLDRIDNNKGYYPENCRWIDRKAQNNNKENNIKLTINGKAQTLQQHIEDPEINVYNLDNDTVWARIFVYEWSMEKAFSTPIGGIYPTYTINGKIQTLTQHIADPEINVHGLKKTTVKTRFFVHKWTLEETFSIPLGGKRKSQAVI